MIACQKCANINPMGARYCRKCGEKIDTSKGQVAEAVVVQAKVQRTRDLWTHARGLLPFGAFCLACALAFRLGLVPDPPLPDAPMPPVEALMPAIGAGAATVAAPAAPPPPAASTTMPVPARWAWRRQVGARTLRELGVDPAAVRARQAEILAARNADGGWNGPQRTVATALGILACGAWPGDDALVAAAQAGVRWLQKKPLRELSGAPRAAALVALHDAGAIDDAQLAAETVALLDGTSPALQAWSLANLPPRRRPLATALLAQKLPVEGPWTDYFALLKGEEPVGGASPYFAESARTIPGGEERMAWAFCAWHRCMAPRDLADTLKAWSTAASAPAAPSLAKDAGAFAPTALWVLTITAPLHTPPLALRAP